MLILACGLIPNFGRAQTWINEIHYDNSGADVGEFVEVLLPGGAAPGDYTVTLYNGSNGEVYNQKGVDTCIQGNSVVGARFYECQFSGIQNGPDGIVLSGPNGIYQFLSYGATFVATEGVADGWESRSIGVTESGQAPPGGSIGLTGSGVVYSDYVWQRFSSDSPGRLNGSQNLSSGTIVSFDVSDESAEEGDGSLELTVRTNQTPGGDTDVDVSLVEGDPADLSGFTTQTVTFPGGFSGGDGSPESISIPITDDSEGEGTEVFVFSLASQDASVGGPGRARLVLSDNDPTLILSEFIADPVDPVSVDADAEWVEVFNVTNNDIDLDGYEIADEAASHLISGSVTVPARGFAVLCSNADTGTNGGFSCDYEYGNTVTLNQNQDTIQLIDPPGIVVDEVAYGSGWPLASGQATAFQAAPQADNNVSSNWASAGSRESSYSGTMGDTGSPGTNGEGQRLHPRSTTSAVAGWRMLSSPVTDLTVGDMGEISLLQGIPGEFEASACGNTNFFIGYNGDRLDNSDPGSGFCNDDGYIVPAGTAAALEPGRGFIWYLFANASDPDPTDTDGSTESAGLPLTLSADGPVETGNPTVEFTSSDRVPGGGDAFYLVGNPFSEPFDVDGMSASNGTLSTTLQVWDPDAGSYLARSGDGANSGGNDDDLAAWQGAFAEVTGASLPLTFTFDEGFRQTASAPEFVGLAAAEPNVSRFDLHLTGESGDGSSLADYAAVLTLAEDARQGWDRHDASKLIPPTARYALVALVGAFGEGERRQAVRSLPTTLEQPITMPIDLRLSVPGDVSIGGAAQAGWPEHWTVTLRDEITEREAVLSSGERMELDLNAEDDWVRRLSLTVAPAGGVAAEESPGAADLVMEAPRPNPTRDQATVRLRSGTSQSVTLRVIDALGRVVVSRESVLTAGTETPIVIDVKGVAPGVYVLRIDGETAQAGGVFTVVR